MKSAFSVRDNRALKDAQQYGEHLYHYTSIQSFFGIIKNKELWLGNTASMNDKTELLHFTQELKNAVLADYPEKCHEINRLWSKIDTAVQKGYPFAMSLSTLSDDAAQWERYASGATGVCIDINIKVLAQLFHNHSGFLNTVFYDGDIRQHDHLKIVSEYLSSGKWKGFDNEDRWISNLIATACCHKHKSFSPENETRMIVLSELVDLHSADGVFRVEYECLNNQVKKVLKVNIAKLCETEGISSDSIFDGVLIGPKSIQHIGTIKEFLCANDFYHLADNVHLSECPLR